MTEGTPLHRFNSFPGAHALPANTLPHCDLPRQREKHVWSSRGTHRERPVAGSFITKQSVSSPNFVKYCRRASGTAQRGIHARGGVGKLDSEVIVLHKKTCFTLMGLRGRAQQPHTTVSLTGTILGLPSVVSQLKPPTNIFLPIIKSSCSVDIA
jgi:hypothetical protein